MFQEIAPLRHSPVQQEPDRRRRTASHGQGNHDRRVRPRPDDKVVLQRRRQRAKEQLLQAIKERIDTIPNLWNRIESSDHGLANDPDVWEALEGYQDFWESPIMVDTDVLRMIAQFSPTSMSFLPTRAFRNGPLCFLRAVSEDYPTTLEFFRQFFASPTTTYKRVQKVAQKLDETTWKDIKATKEWFRLGGCLEKYDFLPAGFCDEDNLEIMGIVAEHCARNQWAQKTFAAFASTEVKFNKYALINLLQKRPCWLELIHQDLRSDPEVVATAYSVQPRIPQEVTVEQDTYEYFVPSEDRGLLVEAIKSRRAVASRFKALDLPATALEIISNYLWLPYYARAAFHIGLGFPLKTKFGGEARCLEVVADEDRLEETRDEDWETGSS